MLSFLSAPAWAQTGLPVTMVITGDIAASTDGKVVPTESDSIVVVVSSTGKTVATAQSQISAGSFGVTVSEAASFNGTLVALRLKHGTSTFRLLNSLGAEATLTFNGSVLPLGTTILNVVASNRAVETTTTTGTGTGTTGGTGTTSGGGTNIPTVPSTSGGGGSLSITATTVDPSLTSGDLNADGLTDEADITILKDALAGRIPVDKTIMDVNNDGVVNSRDLIDLIRAVRAIARNKLQPLNNLPRR